MRDYFPRPRIDRDDVGQADPRAPDSGKQLGCRLEPDITRLARTSARLETFDSAVRRAGPDEYNSANPDRDDRDQSQSNPGSSSAQHAN